MIPIRKKNKGGERGPYLCIRKIKIKADIKFQAHKSYSPTPTVKLYNLSSVAVIS